MSNGTKTDLNANKAIEKEEDLDKRDVRLKKPTDAPSTNKRIVYKITKGQVNHVLKLIESGYSERAACREVGVNNTTFKHSVARIQAIEQYARATAILAENQINLMESTINDMREGLLDAHQARVELDARKWFASKLLPKKYGDRVEHEQNINVTFNNGVPRPKFIEGDTTSSVPKELPETSTSDST